MGCRRLANAVGLAVTPVLACPIACGAGADGVPSRERPLDTSDELDARQLARAEGSSRCSALRCGSSGCAAVEGDGDCRAPLPGLEWSSSFSGWLSESIEGMLPCAGASHADPDSDVGEVSFVVDFEAAPEAFELIAELDADFDPALRLERGRCADPVEIASNDDHADGVERAVISRRLEPGRYRLVVSAEHDGEPGGFRLRLTAIGLEPSCLGPPVNDTCEGAIELDPEAEVQSFVGSTYCASNDASSLFGCIGGDYEPDVLYRLDLSDRTTSTLLHASTDLPPTNFDTVLTLLDDVNGRCFAPIACNDDGEEMSRHSELSSTLIANLDPGVYFLAVDGMFDRGDFGLRVSLDELSCAPNDSCAKAIEIEPVVGEQVLPIGVGCTSTRTTGCPVEYQARPDLFYRLDLSEYEQPMRLRATSGAWFSSVALLRTSGSVECAIVHPSRCFEDELDLVLAPEIYTLMVSLDPAFLSPAELQVSLSPVDAAEFSLCVDTAIAECAADACCEGAQGWGCLEQLMFCRLEVTARSCVCELAPRCCERGSDWADCAPALDACGHLCAEVDATSLCHRD